MVDGFRDRITGRGEGCEVFRDEGAEDLGFRV